MDLLFFFVAGLICLFGFVVLFGAPYLPTMRPQAEAAFDLLDLQPGQHLLELGCGDGKMLLLAARRGLTVTGYEINPLLALLCWLRTLRYRGQVRVVWGNFWTRKLPAADGIFVFLLPKYMTKLDTKIIHEMQSWRLAAPAAPVRSRRITDTPPLRASHQTSESSKLVPRYKDLRLVSFAFVIPGKKRAAQKDGVYLYRYR